MKQESNLNTHLNAQYVFHGQTLSRMLTGVQPIELLHRLLLRAWIYRPKRLHKAPGILWTSQGRDSREDPTNDHQRD